MTGRSFLPFLTIINLFFAGLSIPGFATTENESSPPGTLYEELTKARQERERLHQNAEAGDPQAQYDLAILYSDGQNAPKDENKVIEWMTKAAEGGHVKAQFLMGTIYFNGWYGVTQNYQESAQWYTMAAEQGSADAQRQIGSMYLSGKGFTKNINRAIEWLTKAAEQNDPYAQQWLGTIYSKEKKNEEAAAKWRTKAAEQGIADMAFVKSTNDRALLIKIALKCPDIPHTAEYAVSKLIENAWIDQELLEEIALEANSFEARALAIKALDNQDLLRKIALDPKAPSDREAAASKLNDPDLLKKIGGKNARFRLEYLALFEKANAGDIKAQIKLAEWFHTQPHYDYEEAYVWYTKAAEQGHAEAQYITGKHVKETQRAVLWFTKAAEQGHAGAQYELARCYERGGNGVPKNEQEAAKWYALAAKQGYNIHSSAVEKLTDQTLLKKIALESKDRDVRASAVKKLYDPILIKKIAMSDKDRYVRLAAVEKISGQTILADFAYKAEYFDVRIAAIEKLTDQSILTDLAKTDSAARIRLTAVKNVSDDDFLYDRSCNDSSAEVRFQATDQIKSQTLLSEIAADSYYGELRELAKSKITDSSLQAKIELCDTSTEELLEKIKASDETAFLTDMSLHGGRDQICLAAVNKLTDQSALGDIAAKCADREVTKIALDKLINPEVLGQVSQNAIDPAVVIAAEVKAGRQTWPNAFIQATQANAQEEDLGNVLAAVSLFTNYQPRVNHLVTRSCLKLIQQGNESRIPELVDLLHAYGDKQLCEDYLNCGQPDLDTAGRTWASNHGYSIGTGSGSARARWGSNR